MNDSATLSDPRRQERAAHERNKLHKRLLRLTGQAIAQLGMIRHGDRDMVCRSDGKDNQTIA